MDLRAIGVADRTVKSTADRQCHHGVGTWPEDADFLEEGLEVDSEEGVGLQLQRRFHHESRFGYFVFALCALLVYGLFDRLVLYYLWSSFILSRLRPRSWIPNRKIIICTILYRLDYNGRDTRPIRHNSDI